MPTGDSRESLTLFEILQSCRVVALDEGGRPVVAGNPAGANHEDDHARASGSVAPDGWIVPVRRAPLPPVAHDRADLRVSPNFVAPVAPSRTKSDPLAATCSELHPFVATMREFHAFQPLTSCAVIPSQTTCGQLQPIAATSPYSPSALSLDFVLATNPCFSILPP